MCEVQLLPLQATLRALLDLITKPYGGGNLFYLLSHNIREIHFYEISFLSFVSVPPLTLSPAFICSAGPFYARSEDASSVH